MHSESRLKSSLDFSAPTQLNESLQRAISPTNNEHMESSENTAVHSNSLQPASPAINELVMKLSSQSLNSSHLSTQYGNGIPAPHPTRCLPSPIEDNETEVSLPNTQREIDRYQKYHAHTPPHDEMMHPNIFSSFLPQGADHYSYRTQRQILQERQCRPTFTRDLRQLLEGMIEKEDQCRLATSTMSSPPPSRGRARSFSPSSVGTSASHKSHGETTHEDEGFCETSLPYASAFNTPALRSAATSIYSRHSASESRMSSKHRRVASEGNIEIDFDTHDSVACSLRSAAAPGGIAKSGRPRGRGDVNGINRVVEWRKKVPRLRKSRKDMFKRKVL